MKILLLGSSIIKQWENIHIHENNQIINNGINGLLTKTLMSHSYLNDITKVGKPTHIILYCGGNDLRKNIDPKIIFENLLEFIEELQSMYLNSKIIIISIIKSPIMYKKNIIDSIENINNNLKTITKTRNNVYYMNINKELKNSIYFKKDEIHLTNAGYEIMNTKINNFIGIII